MTEGIGGLLQKLCEFLPESPHHKISWNVELGKFELTVFAAGKWYSFLADSISEFGTEEDAEGYVQQIKDSIVANPNSW